VLLIIKKQNTYLCHSDHFSFFSAVDSEKKIEALADDIADGDFNLQRVAIKCLIQKIHRQLRINNTLSVAVSPHDTVG